MVRLMLNVLSSSLEKNNLLLIRSLYIYSFPPSINRYKDYIDNKIKLKYLIKIEHE